MKVCLRCRMPFEGENWRCPQWASHPAMEYT
jgi:hypothetical protein